MPIAAWAAAGKTNSAASASRRSSHSFAGRSRAREEGGRSRATGCVQPYPAARTGEPVGDARAGLNRLTIGSWSNLHGRAWQAPAVSVQIRSAPPHRGWGGGFHKRRVPPMMGRKPLIALGASALLLLGSQSPAFAGGDEGIPFEQLVEVYVPDRDAVDSVVSQYD